MKTLYPTPDQSTPLPSNNKWLKLFNNATGDPDPKRQATLAKDQQLSYRSGVGELIWAMTTCRPDLAYTAVKLSQSNTAPDTIHFNILKYALKFLYKLREDGIYFWCTAPRSELPDGLSPTINSNKQDIFLSGRPQFEALTAHAYAGFGLGNIPQDTTIVWRSLHLARRRHDPIQMLFPTHRCGFQHRGQIYGGM